MCLLLVLPVLRGFRCQMNNPLCFVSALVLYLQYLDSGIGDFESLDSFETTSV